MRQSYRRTTLSEVSYGVGIGSPSHDSAVAGKAEGMLGVTAPSVSATPSPMRSCPRLGTMAHELVVDRLPFMATSIMATLESIPHGLPRHHHPFDADGGRATVTGMGHH